MGVTTLDPATIKADQRARVVVFQTWIGLGDLQLLIDLRSGNVMSFDHGDCFSDTSVMSDPIPVIAPIPGVPATHGNDARLVAAAVDRIESLSDEVLLQAVSRMPLGDLWRSDVDRRLQIAQWLAYRRDRLREGMKLWV
jgi:hypothetical protein